MKQTIKLINKFLVAAFILSHITAICVIILNDFMHTALDSSSVFMWLPPLLSSIIAFVYTWRNTSPRAARVLAIFSALYILFTVGSIACMILITPFFIVVYYIGFLICPESMNMFFFLTFLDIPRDSLLDSIVSDLFYPILFLPPLVLLIWNIWKSRKLARKHKEPSS